MRQELLKTLTAEDIQEILDSGQLLWENREEPTAANILHHLLDENDCPQSIGERFPLILKAAEQATSWKLTNSRVRENTLIRSFVAYRLRKEGYSHSEIGKMINRDHSTITHLVFRMRDMLSLPNAYKLEVEQYKRFEEML